MNIMRWTIGLMLVLLGFLSSIGLGLASAGEIYKWTDKNGTMIFSESPPPVGAMSEKLILDEIANKPLRLGVTTDQEVLQKFGKPTKINRTMDSRGIHEQWIYRYSRTFYFYFDNGILTSVQD